MRLVPLCTAAEAGVPPLHPGDVALSHLGMRANTRFEAGVHVCDACCNAVVALMQATVVVAQCACRAGHDLQDTLGIAVPRARPRRPTVEAALDLGELQCSGNPLLTESSPRVRGHLVGYFLPMRRHLRSGGAG